MNELEIRFWLMVLGHLFADYTLQGWLADFKQKEWWQRNILDFKQSRYKYDYIAALACHAFYWAIIVCLPLYGSRYLTTLILVNAITHAWIDDEKANRHSINLVQDQLLHGLQIVCTFVAYVIQNGGAS